MKQIYAYLLVVIGLSSLYGQYGDIPASRMAPSGWQNIQFNDPGGWTTINVTQNGLPANDSSIDAGQKLEDIVASTSGRRRIYFPAGTYTFKTTATLNVSGDIWIDGDGMDQTVFNLDFPKWQKINGIEIKGPFNPPGGTSNVDIVGTPNRGDNQITVTNASQFQVGDYVRVKYTYTASDGDEVPVGQFVKVTAKSGTTLTVDLKMGVDFEPGGTVREYDFADNVRVTDLTIRRLRLGDRNDGNLRLVYCRNFEVRNVESIKATTHGILAFECRDGIITECEVHERWGNEGGYAYGITVGQLSTRVHVTNNYCYNLRHHIELANSPNHCVISYNKTDPLYAYSDIGAHHGDQSHNNLFEGNDGRQIVMALDAHAKAWWNTFYRNKADGTVGSQSSQFETTTIVGNETPGISFSGSNNYKGANIVNGVFQADSLAAGSNLPASLYLSSQPSYVASWPLFGPGTGGGGQTGGTFEAEDLPVYDSAHPEVKASGAMSNGFYSFISDCVDNDFIEYTVNVAGAGLKNLEIRASVGPARGQWQLVLNGVDTGAVFDAYSASWGQTTVNMGALNFLNGDNKIAFRIVGKNPAATSRNVGYDYFAIAGQKSEAENLPVYDSAHPEVKASGAMSNGFYSFISDCVDNDFIEYTINVANAGLQNLKIRSSVGPARGKWQLVVNGVDTGAVFDAYSASWGQTTVDRGLINFVAGDNKIAFRIAGKNANATSLNVGFDYFLLE